MQFLYPPLAWGFLLVSLPVLIHLINMLRHRRVKWAAMDFLLESHRKNRRWVMLKQWLLLLARMAALALLTLLLARWVSSSQWLTSLGQTTTHHFVLLDDSYSMAESNSGKTAYSQALSALNGLVRNIASQPGQHQLTLLRYSRAALAIRDGSDAGRLDTAADLSAQSVPEDPARLLDRITASAPTGLALSALAPLELIRPSIAGSTQRRPRVYLLTDVRQQEFGEPAELRRVMQTLADNQAQFYLIDCGLPGIPNVGIVSAQPQRDVWAAGVPLIVRFQVRNQSTVPQKNVVVRVRSIAYPAGTEPQSGVALSGEVVDLPPVVIEQIDALETVTRQVQVLFSQPGSHVVEVSTADDALAFDNKRWAVIDIRQAQRVLLVDGDAAQSNAFYVQTVVNPDKRLATGIDIAVESDDFLRDVAPEALLQFDVVGLLDVPRLDPIAIGKLTDFVKSGHGLLMTAGPNSNIKNLSELFYADGQGPFPAPVIAIDESTPSTGIPQVALAGHPILEPLSRLSSSPFFALQIRKSLRLDPEIMAARGVEPVAMLPGQVPVVVDMPLGEGHVVSILTGLTAEWSNWTTDPTFVVLLLRSLGYLGSFHYPETEQPVSTPIDLVVRDRQLLPDAELIFPGKQTGPRFQMQMQVEDLSAAESEQVAGRVSFDVESGQTDRDVVDAFLQPGVFEAWFSDASGNRIVRNLAHNVEPAEGDLEVLSRSELTSRMQGLPVSIQSAEELAGRSSAVRDTAQSTVLLALLGVLLMAEQWLAYSCSYHGTSTGGALPVGAGAGRGRSQLGGRS